jgi:signal peptidase I
MSVVTEKRTKSGGGETIKIIVQALLLALIVRTLLFQPFNIPSGSMKSTLLVGDYLFVSKYAYGYSRFSLPLSPHIFDGRVWSKAPERGDIVVFKLPRDDSTDYIKRVIGLPGDRIQVREGVLYINDVAVPRVQEGTFADDGFEYQRYRETLPNGVSYITLDRDPNGLEDDTQVFEVPPGNYFMMGDNRDNSTDSRVAPTSGGVGFVPFENLVGRAEIIFFSVEEGEPAWAFWNWPRTIRWDRLFKVL